MNLQEIKAAVNAGKTVYCCNRSYQVIKDNLDQWFIVCGFNDYCTALTEVDGKTLNGLEAEFFVGKS